MRILIAPNAMKGSLPATEFAKAISEGLQLADNSIETIQKPLADGGDGTNELIIKALNGEFIPVKVHDPLGRLIDCRFGWLSEKKCAIIEMAEPSGLKLLANHELNPMVASSIGTGELVRSAIMYGAQEIILGIGGSATVDGGIGMLKGLGFLLTDSSGVEIPQGGNGLIHVAHIIKDNVDHNTLNCKIVIATDVTNPLTGKEGAATVYGPQKGATPKMVEELEAGFLNYLSVLEHYSHKNLADLEGGGAAGGIAVPLVALLGARIVSGAEFVIDLLGVLDDIRNCDLVITGEGCVDIQTCQGKGPAVIAHAAHESGIPVIALGGAVGQEASELFDGIFSITNGPMSLQKSMQDSYNLTKSAAFQLGRFLKSISK